MQALNYINIHDNAYFVNQSAFSVS